MALLGAVAERETRASPSTSSCVVHIVFDVTPLMGEPLPSPTQDNDEVEVQGGRVYLHLGARRDDAERR
jgi:hypothetical protein